MKFLIVALLFISGSVFASGDHHDHDSVATTSLSLPSQSTYGLLALPDNQFDWGVPDKLQVGVTMAFTEGGNQSFAVGAATRIGGVMIHGQFKGIIDGPDTEDDYAIIVGGTMHF